MLRRLLPALAGAALTCALMLACAPARAQQGLLAPGEIMGNPLTATGNAPARHTTVELAGALPVNIRSRGAVCSSGGGADQFARIQAAIDATPTGGTLVLPACPVSTPYYVVTGTGSCIFTRTSPINIVGEGRTGSNIGVTASVPNTRDVFCMTPSTLNSPAFINGWSFRDFRIAQIGAAAARHAINFNVPLGNLALNVSIDRMTFDATSGGNSFRLTNDPATATGGMAYSQITNSTMESIYLDTAGDGITIRGNVIAATGTNIGVRASFVTGAGGFLLDGNVISGLGCIVCIVNGGGVEIVNNYIETSGANSYGFLVDINTSAGVMLSPQLVGNQYSVTTGTPIPVRIRNNVFNARLSDMRYLVTSGNQIQVDAGATDTSIDRNAQWISGGVAGAPAIGDSGTRTRTFPGNILAGSLMLGSSFTYGVGAQNSGTLLTANANTVAPPTLTFSNEIWPVRVVGSDGKIVGIVMDAFGTGNTTAFAGLGMLRYNGTAASPTAIKNGDVMGVVDVHGMGTTVLSAGSGQLRFNACEDWSDTAQCTNVSLWTTATGTAGSTVAQRLTVAGSGFVGVGIVAPTATLHVSANASATLSSSITSNLKISGADNVSNNIIYETFGNASAISGFIMRKAATSGASPSQITSGTLLGFAGASGYTNASAYSGINAQVRFNASEDLTATAGGMEINFLTTPKTTTTPAIAATVQASGGFSVGDAIDPGIGTIRALNGFIVSTAAKTLILKQGANGAVGTFVCNGATPVTVSNTNVAISDGIGISLNTVGGTVGALPAIKTITAATGFTVACTAADTSTMNYWIIKNAAWLLERDFAPANDNIPAHLMRQYA